MDDLKALREDLLEKPDPIGDYEYRYVWKHSREAIAARLTSIIERNENVLNQLDEAARKWDTVPSEFVQRQLRAMRGEP